MEPAVKPAAERTRTRHVGVMATPATFQGELFASLVDRFGKEVTVHTQVCPELVPLVEAGELDYGGGRGRRCGVTSARWSRLASTSWCSGARTTRSCGR